MSEQQGAGGVAFISSDMPRRVTYSTEEIEARAEAYRREREEARARKDAYLEWLWHSQDAPAKAYRDAFYAERAASEARRKARAAARRAYQKIAPGSIKA